MELTNIFPQMILVISVLAFTVSVITQVIKGIGVFSKIPTDLVVFILSIVLTVVSAVAYAQIKGFMITWYMIPAFIVLGFFVAFVAMYGWEKFSQLWGRFNQTNN